MPDNLRTMDGRHTIFKCKYFDAPFCSLFTEKDIFCFVGFNLLELMIEHYSVC